MHTKVAIIIVTYNPDIKELNNNISSYVFQSDLIVIVDNSTDKKIQNSIKNTFNTFANITVITLEDNYGIAKAQNIGLKHAIENGYEYFIEMDQDSELTDNYIKNITKSYTSLLDSVGLVAGIGPIAVNKKDNSKYHNRDTSTHLIEIDKTLSSGFFLSKEALHRVGFKDEILFIDLVDWEWCWRAKSKGLKVYVDTTLTINHLLGEGHKNFYFFKLGIPLPFRHYYQYRNSLILSFRSYIPLDWKIKRMAIHLIKPIFIIFFYDKKFERFKYIIRGVLHGISTRRRGK
jgi:rhamnosyltransferase